MDTIAIKKPVADLVSTKYCVFFVRDRLRRHPGSGGHGESLKDPALNFSPPSLHAYNQTSFTLWLHILTVNTRCQATGGFFGECSVSSNPLGKQRQTNLSPMTTLKSSLLTSVSTALHLVTLTLPHSHSPPWWLSPCMAGWRGAGCGMNDVSSSFLSFLYLPCYVHGVVSARSR